MLRRPLQLGQLGALYWLCSNSSLVTCEAQRPPADAPAAPPSQGDRLKLVQAVFRHGARTPLTDKFWQETGARFESGTVCGQLLPQRPAISIRNAADGGPQPFAKHDAAQVMAARGSTHVVQGRKRADIAADCEAQVRSLLRHFCSPRQRGCCRAAARRAS
jgi:hypothetical protein